MQAARITNELVVKEKSTLEVAAFSNPQISVENVNWCEWKLALKDTLRYLREMAAKLKEPTHITLRKMDAVRRHDPRTGTIAICNLGTEESPILKGIPIRKKLTSQ